LANPDQAPKVKASIDDLQGRINSGKKVAKDAAPEEPAMENLKKILLLLYRAQTRR
jgi:hypothetical protein